MLSHTGARFMLPVDTTRAMHEVSSKHFSSSFRVFDFFQEYEEVIIPPARPVPPRATERLIPVSELDDLAKPCFPVGLRHNN